MLDINLPDVSGIELCKKIKKEFPRVRILSISTFGERSYISRMIENGASGYLVKSASAEEIAAAIDTAMEGRLYMSVDIAGEQHGSFDPAGRGTSFDLSEFHLRMKGAGKFPRADTRINQEEPTLAQPSFGPQKPVPGPLLPPLRFFARIVGLFF